MSLGAIGGAVAGKLIYDRGCEGSHCNIDNVAVIATFAGMGALAGFLVGRSDREDVPASHPLDEIWERHREAPVPATPPDSLPGWIYAPGNVARATKFIGREFVPNIVVVAFHAWAPVHARQLAIDLVNGAVVGGEPALDGEGFYYVLIRDDGSGRWIREAAGKLSEQSEVAVAAPRYADDR